MEGIRFRQKLLAASAQAGYLFLTEQFMTRVCSYHFVENGFNPVLILFFFNFILSDLCSSYCSSAESTCTRFKSGDANKYAFCAITRQNKFISPSVSALLIQFGKILLRKAHHGGRAVEGAETRLR